MSTLYSQKLVETPSRFTAFITVVVSLLIVIGVNIIHAKYNAVINRALVFTLVLLTLKCINNKICRNVLAIILLIPVAADITLQLYAWSNFNSAFSYGFALSVLNTTPGEASSMLGLYWRDCLIFIGLSAFFIFTANTGMWPVAPRFRRWPAIALAVTLLSFYAQALQHQLRKSSVESLAQRVVQATPVSTSKVFMQALEDNAVVANIGKNIPDYKITLSDTGIENYVLIIGESERTANMSIYGYQRDTTPELEKQKSQLLLFRNAVTPAPVTIMAVPLALTADTVNARDPRKYGDNVINIANKAGYDTYWFSRQGKGGAHNNVITGIALNTKQHEWIDGGYDEDLLPLLQNALKTPGKKLIVLHLYGSHEPSCRRFPASQAVLQGDNEADVHLRVLPGAGRHDLSGLRRLHPRGLQGHGQPHAHPDAGMDPFRHDRPAGRKILRRKPAQRLCGGSAVPAAHHHLCGGGLPRLCHRHVLGYFLDSGPHRLPRVPGW